MISHTKAYNKEKRKYTTWRKIVRGDYRLPMKPVLKLEETDVLLPTVFTSKNTFEAKCGCDSWPEEIANLIGRCWNHDTDRRPSFDEIYEFWNFHRDRLMKHRFRESGAWWFKTPPPSPATPTPEGKPPFTPKNSKKKRKDTDNLGPLARMAAKKSADRMLVDETFLFAPGEPSLSL